VQQLHFRSWQAGKIVLDMIGIEGAIVEESIRTEDKSALGRAHAGRTADRPLDL
jgi:hypothetical protein